MNIITTILGSAGLSLVATVSIQQSSILGFGIAFISLISLANLYQLNELNKSHSKIQNNIKTLYEIKQNKKSINTKSIEQMQFV